MAAAIIVAGLGKRYQIGGGRRPWSRQSGRGDQDLWALRDLAFEVPRGQSLGIIGRNGAGKSTLLKIMSRITAPTCGRAELRGRVHSLLEVGTGFHPELTGRENVFLNGVLLGMRRAEVAAKLDAIAAFAGVESFLDTPVKRFSSGMRVRLAFAVAAHIEPDVLMVDEVLAVGDAEFQRRSLGKLHEVTRTGRTVVFVSHDMGAVLRLTDRCLLLEGGRLVADGDPDAVVGRYLGAAPSALRADLRGRRRAQWLDSVDCFELVGVEVVAPGGSLRAGQPLEVRIAYRAHQNVAAIDLGVGIAHANGTRLITCRSGDAGFALDAVAGQEGGVVMHIDAPPLAPGEYVLQLYANTGGARDLDALDDALRFEVAPDTSDRHAVKRLGRGSLGLRPPSRWHGMPPE